MKTKMSILLFALMMMMGSFSFAARILSGKFDANNKSVTLTVAFEGGCEMPEFYIDWKKCGVDQETGKIFLAGLLLAQHEVIACGQNIEQEIEFDISNISCNPEMIILKSTSSKVPFIINK